MVVLSVTDHDFLLSLKNIYAGDSVALSLKNMFTGDSALHMSALCSADYQWLKDINLS